MLKTFYLFYFLCSFLFSFSARAQDESVKAPHVRLSVISANKVLSPGENQFAFLFELEDEWHVYWSNPGDSGAAPKFKLIAINTLTQESAIEVLWPRPHRIPVGPFFNFGYEGEVAFPFTLKLSKDDLVLNSIEYQFKIEWLVCKEECVPGFATLKLKRPLAAQSQSDFKSTQIIKKYLEITPVPKDIFSSSSAMDESVLEFEGRLNFKKTDWVDVFPYSGEFFSAHAPEVEFSNGIAKVKVQRQQGSQPTFPQSFLIVHGEGEKVQTFDLQVKQPEQLVQTGMPLSAKNSIVSEDKIKLMDYPSGESFIILILFAFIGGLILNLMPCVFPILSIKVFSLLKSRAQPKDLFWDSLTYFVGVVVSFLALGAAFIALRMFGQSIGWGFQLQSPLFVYIMCIVFFALALNFLGIFEIGESLMSWAGQKSHQKSSSFLNGVLSVLVATPCTGPFMGSALGAAAALSSLEAMTIFLFLGFGMGAPFLILGFSPKLLTFLPKPGAWMQNLKEFFAFPMFATVLWLSWILVRQVGTEAMFPLGVGILGMSLFIWAKTRTQNSLWKKVFVGLAVISSLLPLSAMHISPPEKSEQSRSSWNSFSPEKITELRQLGKAVFVDFTADWCITCQWNKKAVLETEEVLRIFSENNVYLMRADWTNQDATITRALAEFGRASVPVYAFYPAKKQEGEVKDPELLPQILTTDMIRQLFNKEIQK